MQHYLRIYVVATLILLLATLVFGVLASWAFLYPETYNRFLPFYQLRPFHVSAALFWIISGATAGILHYKNEAFDLQAKGRPRPLFIAEQLFIYTWLLSITAIFICYGLNKYGGREYWEFPPTLCIPLLCSWLMLMVAYFIPWYKNAGETPMYVWMWSTGIFFFLVTFIEQNLWVIPWFRQSYLREITVQWKANGSMVGAWNQMIYGTELYMMVKISGNERLARGRTVFIFYMLGLTNLMFNWGHHLYNVPAASWIRDVSYVVSMTEWIFLIRMIQGFRNTLQERARHRHILAYRFIVASEFWVFMNLLLTLGMSIPAINRYTHGTHITVAHAMGATIGINSMILLGSFCFLLDMDRKSAGTRRWMDRAYWLSQFGLGGFWLTLIAAGMIRAYRTTALNIGSFQEMMRPVWPVLKLFSLTGIVLALALGTITVILIYNTINHKIEKPAIHNN